MEKISQRNWKQGQALLGYQTLNFGHGITNEGNSFLRPLPGQCATLPGSLHLLSLVIGLCFCFLIKQPKRVKYV